MCKDKATTIFTQTSKGVSGWDEAIADARKLIRREQSPRRVAGLRQAVATFKELRDAGMPFPGADTREPKQDAQ